MPLLNNVENGFLNNKTKHHKPIIMKKIIIVALLGIIGMNLSAQGYQVKKKEKEASIGNSKLGKNILGFYPMQFIVSNLNQDEPDLTVGLSYERIMDNDFMSFKLPVHMSLNENFFYVLPTLKLYPTKQGVVRFAVGPQLLMAFGDGQYQVSQYDPNNGYYTRTVKGTRKQFGFLVNPSLNITMAEHFYLDVESSLGIIYYDNMPQANSNFFFGTDNTSSVSPAFQFGFAFGYRF